MQHSRILPFMLLVGLTACNTNDIIPQTEIQSIQPVDGATGVSRTTSIEITFSEPMDTESCESRFGLFQGFMEEIPGNMAGTMAGQFQWNKNQSMMTFDPDSLVDYTMYSICLQEGLITMEGDEDMMSEGMMDHEASVAGGIIATFQTGSSN